MLGEYSYGGTPSYIPNLEVKPIYADGTWLEAAWESMNLPSKIIKREASASLSFLVICQIVLIKKFRLTINIIKRIFLRIKILKRFSFLYN